MDELLLLLLQWFKPVAIYSTVALSVFKIGVAFWWRPRRIQRHFYRQGIRGPPYRFFIGNVKEIVSMMTKASSQPMPCFSHNILPRVLSFYHHWKKIYGSTFIVWFGPTVRLTVSDPDLIREIFTSKSEVFEKSDQHPLVKQLEGNGLLSLKGEKWAHHRRIMTPTFYMENLKMLVPVVTNSVTEMLDKWAGMMSEAGEVEIEVLEWFQNLTEDVITRMAFGASYLDGKAIFRLQAQQMELAAEAFQKVFIPGYSFLPTRRNVMAWKLDREVRKSLVKLIESREREGRRSEGEYVKDLLGMMIDASRWCPEMTKEDILEECKGFFFAGKHSTSNMLTWTTLLLAMHPQWQLLARDEISRVCGSRNVPTRDDLVKLKTLTMIVNESLRLYPPVIAMIRQAKADAELGGYTIPRGTEILIPVLAVHHDQAVWGGDANEFNPGRFAEGVARAAAKYPGALIPFGMGVRTCIGQNLAVLQAKLSLAMMIRRFSFRLSPSYRHAPTVLMLLYPQHGAPIIFDRFIDPPATRDQVS